MEIVFSITGLPFIYCQLGKPIVTDTIKVHVNFILFGWANCYSLPTGRFNLRNWEVIGIQPTVTSPAI